MTTYEEAKRCPRCGEMGEHASELDRSLSSPRGAKLTQFFCRNNRCKWFNTSWAVQVNPDGTIPPALLNREKRFPALPGDGGRTEAAIRAQVSREIDGGGEISSRR